MTLHAAIEQVLAREKRAMTPVEIADTLNKNSWYSKKDGSLIKSSQIGARVKNYPHLFVKEGSYVSLKNKTGVRKVKATPKEGKAALSSLKNKPELALKVLMNEKNFKPAYQIDSTIPKGPGLYCIRVKDITSFETNFTNVLAERKHNIIYIGIASQSLDKRLKQELRARGHGTFFRSIGAVLGFTPKEGSLVGKKNQNNYKFSKADEEKIIEWINQNLLVNWIELQEDLGILESELINKHIPLLNTAGNPGALRELTELRNNCKRIACHGHKGNN